MVFALDTHELWIHLKDIMKEGSEVNKIDLQTFILPEKDLSGRDLTLHEFPYLVKQRELWLGRVHELHFSRNQCFLLRLNERMYTWHNCWFQWYLGHCIIRYVWKGSSLVLKYLVWHEHLVKLVVEIHLQRGKVWHLGHCVEMLLVFLDQVQLDLFDLCVSVLLKLRLINRVKVSNCILCSAHELFYDILVNFEFENLFYLCLAIPCAHEAWLAPSCL